MPVQRYVNYFCLAFVASLVLLLFLDDRLYELYPTLTLLYVFAPYWFLPVPGLFIVALAFRARGALLAVFGAALLFLVHFHLLGQLIPGTAEMDAEPKLLIANLNLGPGQAQPEEIVAALKASRADLVGLQELTAPVARQIEAELGEAYPYQALSPHDQSTGLLSRYPILAADWIQATPLARAFLHGVLEVDGQRLHVLVVHPMPPLVSFLPGTLLPTGLDGARQQEHLIWAAEYAEELAHEPLVLVGDLNMVAESPAYHRLTDSFVDTHVAAGFGMGFTFPQDLRLGGRGIPGPFVRLDYIFHSSAFTTLSSQVRCLPGSDHCLLAAELALKAKQ